ncbi:MAG: hypothetical protein ACRDHL_14605 [Candidatus Promineifilaceae bacterium]
MGRRVTDEPGGGRVGVDERAVRPLQADASGKRREDRLDFALKLVEQVWLHTAPGAAQLDCACWDIIPAGAGI